MRARAGIRHVLQTLCDFGNCASEYDALVKASIKLLTIEKPMIEEAIRLENEEKNIILDDINDVSCVFPTALYKAEVSAAKYLHHLSKNNPPWGKVDVDKALPWVEKKTGLKLSPSQRQAIQTILKNKLSIITGGPGVGKTTLVQSLLKIINSKKVLVSLCAPTGRAAKRLSETTGLTAKNHSSIAGV